MAQQPLPLFSPLMEGMGSVVVSLVLFPLLLPYIVYQRVLVSWRLISSRSSQQGGSVTALVVLQARYLLHLTGFRKDPISVKLWRHSPLCPPYILERPFALALSLLSLIIGNLPVVPFFALLQVNIKRYQDRSRFFDSFLDDYGHENVSLVLFGAGYDCRGYQAKHQQSTYEIDTAPTQRAKRKLLYAAGIPEGNVTYVQCDFESVDDPWQKLKYTTSFSNRMPFVGLWEGVTMYLHEDAVISFLKSASTAMAGNAHAYLMFDYIVKEEQDVMITNSFGKSLRLNEEWKCFLPRNFDGWMQQKGVVGLTIQDWASNNGSAQVVLAAA